MLSVIIIYDQGMIEIFFFFPKPPQGLKWIETTKLNTKKIMIFRHASDNDIPSRKWSYRKHPNHHVLLMFISPEHDATEFFLFLSRWTSTLHCKLDHHVISLTVYVLFVRWISGHDIGISGTMWSPNGMFLWKMKTTNFRLRTDTMIACYIVITSFQDFRWGLLTIWWSVKLMYGTLPLPPLNSMLFLYKDL